MNKTDISNKNIVDKNDVLIRSFTLNKNIKCLYEY